MRTLALYHVMDHRSTHTKLSPALLARLRSLLDLYSIVDHQVHKLIKSLKPIALVNTFAVLPQTPLTLIRPSILIANCSYSQICTVECCCRSLKMKLIGGRSTLRPPPPPPRFILVWVFERRIKDAKVRVNLWVYRAGKLGVGRGIWKLLKFLSRSYV